MYTFCFLYKNKKKTSLTTGYTNIFCNRITAIMNMTVITMIVIGHWRYSVIILKIDIYACNINLCHNNSLFL